MSKEKVLDETETTNCLGTPHNVILFNDEVHSMDEVMIQVIVSLNCTEKRAYELVMMAHSKGRAIVFTGGLEVCELKEGMLKSPPAHLKTAIEVA